MLKTILLCSIAVLAFKSNAQSQDYVVTLKGDTIPCKISGMIKYKCDNPADLVKIKLSRVSYFYTGKKKKLQRVVFVNRDENEWTPDLMTVVENGKISIYQAGDSNLRNFDGSPDITTVWYVGKGTDSVRVLKSSNTIDASKQRREDELGEMLKDNKDVYDKYIADDKFSFKQIRNLVHLYNTGEPPKN